MNLKKSVQQAIRIYPKMASAAVGSMLAASGKLNKFAMPERHLGYLQEMVRKHPESYKEVCYISQESESQTSCVRSILSEIQALSA